MIHSHSEKHRGRCLTDIERLLRSLCDAINLLVQNSNNIGGVGRHAAHLQVLALTTVDAAQQQQL